MKRNIIVIASLLLLTFGCTEQKIGTYTGEHYVSFKNDIKTDSIVTSFFFFPFDETLRIPVPVALGGMPLESDRQFVVSVDKELTTALDKNYDIESSVFRKGFVEDTVWVKLFKTPELETKAYDLVLKIEANDFFESGPQNRLRSKIVFSAIAARPEWWDSSVQKSYLGVYSDKKFLEFIKATDGEGAHFGELEPDQRRRLAIMFLNYLRKAKDSGNTIYEEDGKTEMTITVLS